MILTCKQCDDKIDIQWSSHAERVRKGKRDADFICRSCIAKNNHAKNKMVAFLLTALRLFHVKYHRSPARIIVGHESYFYLMSDKAIHQHIDPQDEELTFSGVMIEIDHDVPFFIKLEKEKS